MVWAISVVVGVFAGVKQARGCRDVQKFGTYGRIDALTHIGYPHTLP